MVEVVAAAAAVALMVTAMTYNQLSRAAVQLRAVWSDMAAVLRARHGLVDDIVSHAGHTTEVPSASIDALRQSRDQARMVEAAERPGAEHALDQALAAVTDLLRASDNPDAHVLVQRIDAVHQQLAGVHTEGLRCAKDYQRTATKFPGTIITPFSGLSASERAALEDPRAVPLD